MAQPPSSLGGDHRNVAEFSVMSRTVKLCGADGLSEGKHRSFVQEEQ